SNSDRVAVGNVGLRGEQRKMRTKRCDLTFIVSHSGHCVYGDNHAPNRLPSTNPISMRTDRLCVRYECHAASGSRATTRPQSGLSAETERQRAVSGGSKECPVSDRRRCAASPYGEPL